MHAQLVRGYNDGLEPMPGRYVVIFAILRENSLFP